jgi:hypothetical protein
VFFEKKVIVCMRPNPKPDDGVTIYYSHCSPTKPDANGENRWVLAYWFELKAGVARVLFPLQVAASCAALNMFWKLLKALLEGFG